MLLQQFLLSRMTSAAVPLQHAIHSRRYDHMSYTYHHRLAFLDFNQGGFSPLTYTWVEAGFAGYDELGDGFQVQHGVK